MSFSTSKVKPADLMDAPLQEILHDALARWEKLTGVEMGQTSFRFGDLDVRAMNEALKRMLELEPAGTTTLMLLEIFLRDFLEGKSFTAAAIMRDYAATMDFLQRAETLFSIVQSDRAAAELGQFRGRVLAGLRHYHADRPDVLAMAEDNTILPFLRRDALESLHSLKPYQFLSGESGDGPAQVIEHIYIAWNINDLLVALRDMPMNGIAVVLLRNPAHPDRSYFTFAMRNGGNVILFTDRNKPAYPGQEDDIAGRGGRMVSRNFARRAWANHFPYQLIPTSWNEEGELVFEKERMPVLGGKALAPLMRIADLPPHQAIWITMMLSLISDRFWRDAWRAPALSYTGAMVRKKDLLIADVDGSHLPAARGYQPIGLEALALEDVSPLEPADIEAVAAIGKFAHAGVNDWMEKRYRDRAPEEILNLWHRQPGEQLLLPKLATESTHSWHSDKSGQLPETAAQLPGGILAVKDQTNVPQWRRVTGYGLRTFSSCEFGTEEEMRADHHFIARANLAQFVQQQADEEYHQRKKEIAGWYRRAIEKNQDGLVDLLARHIAGLPTFEERKGSYRTIYFAPKTSDEWRFKSFQGAAVGEMDYSGARRCLLTGVAATAWRATFAPRDAADVALITGVDVSALPDVLRYWALEKPYIGNHLLGRIDPMDANVHNPWEALRLDANLFLSKRGKAIVDKRADALRACAAPQ